MNPAQLVGNSCWQALQHGGEVTNFANQQFAIWQPSGRGGRLARMINPRTYLATTEKQNVIKELKKRSASHFSDNTRLELRMAVAGLLKYKNTDYQGDLETAPGTPVNKEKLEAFCTPTPSIREDINAIEGYFTKHRLRLELSQQILREDIEMFKQSDEVYSLKIRTSNALSPQIQQALFDYERTIDWEKCLNRLQSKIWAVPRPGEILRRHIDLLMLRIFLYGTGQITVTEAGLAWRDFIAAINSPGMFASRQGAFGQKQYLEESRVDLLNTLLEHCDKLFPKPETTSKKGFIPDTWKESPSLAHHSAEVKPASIRPPESIETYSPAMERSENSPTLRNTGNLCYSNSVIKHYANLIPMDTLKAMQQEPEPEHLLDEKSKMLHELRAQLIELLIHIKYCRAGLCGSGYVNHLNAAFILKLRECSLNGLISPEFATAKQNDAHEFVTEIEKILNSAPFLNTNAYKPEHVFSRANTFECAISDRIKGKKTIIEKDSVLFMPLAPPNALSFDSSFQRFSSKEAINFSWNQTSMSEWGLDEQTVQNHNIQHLDELRQKLQAFQLADSKSSGINASMEVTDEGYFKTVSGSVSLIPPWIKPERQESLRVNPESLKSLIMMPGIFKHNTKGIEKLHGEGMAFFFTCLDGVEIPVSSYDNKELTLKASISGVCCHSGKSERGHYVYIEKNANNTWTLNNDTSITALKDNGEVSNYLLDTKMTPYVYHLKIEPPSS